jgi:hypothetical protein
VSTIGQTEKLALCAAVSRRICRLIASLGSPPTGVTQPIEEVRVGKVEVSNDELCSIRDAGRELGRLVDQLGSGEAEKFVLTKHGQMRAVVVSLEDFADMRSCVVERDLPKAA